MIEAPNLYAVRIPSAEAADFKARLDEFPGVSPAEIFRALLFATKSIGVRNALAKYAAHKAELPKP